MLFFFVPEIHPFRTKIFLRFFNLLKKYNMSVKLFKRTVRNSLSMTLIDGDIVPWTLTCCSSIAALSQLLNVKTLYKTTVAAYKPNKAKTMTGRKRITCFHCVINGVLTFPATVIIHIPRNTVANKSHSISFVIWKFETKPSLVWIYWSLKIYNK